MKIRIYWIRTKWRTAIIWSSIFIFIYLVRNGSIFNGVRETTLGQQDREFFNKKELEMEKRRRKIDEVCRREKLGKFAVKSWKTKINYPPAPNYEMFYFDTVHKLSWCPIYKAASTTWLHNFCILAGITEEFLKNNKTQISDIARKVYPPLDFDEGYEALKESQMRFFVVRHPFDRLLSAYRDKLENKEIGKEHGTEYFYKKYGIKIVRKYRNSANKQSRKKKSKKHSHKDHLNEEFSDQGNPEPTFEEFVRYLIDINLATEADDHWMPYYMHCTPCFIDYDVIAKFETLSEDQQYIIEKTNLQDKIKPIWRHLTKGKQTSELRKRYFSSLSNALILKLFDKYKLDFDMFGYDIKEFLNT